MKCRLLTALFFLCSIAFSQPITGEAKILEFKDNRVIYKGDVKLTRGDALLSADRVEIILDERGKPVKILAVGNVKYVEGNRKARADYAEYDLKADRIILEGSATVEEDKSVLSADRIVYDRKSQSLQALGGAGKVKTLYVEEEDEKIGPDKGDSQKEGDIPKQGQVDSGGDL